VNAGGEHNVYQPAAWVTSVIAIGVVIAGEASLAQAVGESCNARSYRCFGSEDHFGVDHICAADRQ
jgi:hypothetical protein